ncbi:TPA: Mu transposase C-terminal domain-containing protein [Aeromonas dhakensis]|nr:Mu transposase C-terminal domain-containing protein [Aeromonas dhakensis]
MFFKVSDLVGKPGMPSTRQNTRLVLERCSSANPSWRQDRAKGKGFEYHIDCLPPETRAHLLHQQVKDLKKGEVKTRIEIGSEELWLRFQEVGDKKRDVAKKRFEACLMVSELVEREGIGLKKAMAEIAEKTGVSASNLTRWFYVKPGLKRIDKKDWLAALVDENGLNTRRRAELSPEAWSFFQGDWLRSDAPTVTACYERLTRAAALNGWAVPSIDTIKKRIKTHIPLELRVAMRDGLFKAKQSLVPAQRRTRVGLHALAHVNGDGYTHNLWVALPNGEIVRPTTWFFQDVYSSMLLSYCVDVSENTDMLGLALHQMVSRYGVPDACTLDRGSAALSQAMTGRMHRPSGRDRKHKKFDSAEVEGAMKALGVEVSWTRVEADTAGNKGNARAKPIERAFHGKSGLGEYVDRHPAFSLATVGDSVEKKPAHYADSQKNAIPLETFLAVLAEEIEAWNSRTGRRSEMARARGLSYRQVFEESYSQVSVRKATEQQLLLCLMRTEQCRVNEGGLIELKAGQTPLGERNRYHSALLYPYIGTQVSLRFDPFNLHSGVYAYDEKGALIGLIPILEDVGYNDQRGARLQRLAQEEVMGRVELMQNTAQMMTPAEVADQLREAALKRQESVDDSVSQGLAPGLVQMMPELPRLPEQMAFKRAVGCDSTPEPETDILDYADTLIELFGKKD